MLFYLDRVIPKSRRGGRVRVFTFRISASKLPPTTFPREAVTSQSPKTLEKNLCRHCKKINFLHQESSCLFGGLLNRRRWQTWNRGVGRGWLLRTCSSNTIQLMFARHSERNKMNRGVKPPRFIRITKGIEPR